MTGSRWLRTGAPRWQLVDLGARVARQFTWMRSPIGHQRRRRATLPVLLNDGCVSHAVGRVAYENRAEGDEQKEGYPRVQVRSKQQSAVLKALILPIP